MKSSRPHVKMKLEGKMKVKTIIIIIIILLIFYGGYNFFIEERIILENQLKQFCKDKNIDEVCNFYMLECYMDCEELGLNYWKFDAGGWGISECYCKEIQCNKTEVKKIW